MSTGIYTTKWFLQCFIDRVRNLTIYHACMCVCVRVYCMLQAVCVCVCVCVARSVCGYMVSRDLSEHWKFVVGPPA